MPEVRLCAESELPVEGKGKSFEIAGDPPANVSPMYRASLKPGMRRLAIWLSEGEYRCCEDRCPHQDAPLADGTVTGGIVTCNFHFWQFELASGRCLLADWGNLKMYKVSVRDGAAWVELDD